MAIYTVAYTHPITRQIVTRPVADEQEAQSMADWASRTTRNPATIRKQDDTNETETVILPPQDRLRTTT